MSLCRSDNGYPATQETVNVEVEIRHKNHKDDLIFRQVFAFKRCYMAVHRPVVHADGNLIPSSENILILHGNGKFVEEESCGRPETD